MEQVTAFKAGDGTLFNTATEAKKHEARTGIFEVTPNAPVRGWNNEVAREVVEWMIEHHAKIGPLLTAISRTDNKLDPLAPATFSAPPRPSSEGPVGK